MSLHPQPDYPIPDETRRVARAAFHAGNFCLRLADEVDGLYRGDQFAELFLTRGQPAASPARLALVSVLQDVEGLSDYGKDSFQKFTHLTYHECRGLTRPCVP